MRSSRPRIERAHPNWIPKQSTRNHKPPSTKPIGITRWAAHRSRKLPPPKKKYLAIGGGREEHGELHTSACQGSSGTLNDAPACQGQLSDVRHLRRCSKISDGLDAELCLVGATPFGRSSSANARHHNHVARVDSGMGRLRHCADTTKRACRGTPAARTVPHSAITRPSAAPREDFAATASRMLTSRSAHLGNTGTAC